MEKRTSAPARFIAVLALIVAAIVVIVAISASQGGSDSTQSSGGQSDGPAQQRKPRTTAKTYVVKGGDTLISIAHRTGIPVVEILALNPEVDPQILIAGETLKLR